MTGFNNISLIFVVVSHLFFLLQVSVPLRSITSNEPVRVKA